MHKALVVAISIFAACTACSGQWSAGAGLDATNWPPLRLIVAAHGSYELGTRVAITAEFGSNIPHWVHGSGIHAGDPGRLSTGDTATYSWESATRSTSAMALLGLRCVLGQSRKVRHWYWACAMGYGMEHERYKGQSTYTFVHREFQSDERGTARFLLGSLGGGSIWRLKQLDLLTGISVTGWFPPGSERIVTKPKRTQFRPAMQAVAQWHLGR